MRRRAFGTLLGGAATASTVWPPHLRAQPKAMPAVGYLTAEVPGASGAFLDAFRQGLSDTGYIEGQNLTIEYRSAEGRYDRLPALANDLVSRKVDVIATEGGQLAPRAAKNATATIPIVFAIGGDPVAAGVVASLARPGGNLTGVSFLAIELNPKRLELLRELVPQAGAIAVLVNPNSPTADRVVRTMQEAARPNGMQLPILKASSESEIEAGFASLIQRQDGQRQAGALLVSAEPFIDSRRDQIVALAARHAVPAIYGLREIATAGGLISYGPTLTAVYRQVGVYTGRILRGARPADLPVVQPTTFELVVNLRTAKTLGLAMPPSIPARADEVIE